MFKTNNSNNNYNTNNNNNEYNKNNRDVSMREGTQNVDFGGCLSLCSLAKQLVSTQKYIGHANQLL